MSETLLLYAVVGFVAQIIDGAIGMGFGVISASVLVAGGLPPASASVAVHLSKIPAGLASGLAHWRIGNVDGALWGRLILPGLIGGVIGSTLVSLLPLHIIRPVAAVYLAAMGVVILARAVRPPPVHASKRSGILGFFGGLFDSLGGGWGPIVTSGLLIQGHEPRRAIGSANAVEPIVAVIQTAMFAIWLGAGSLADAAGAAAALVAGALVAAPIAAGLVRRLPRRVTVAAVGTVLLSINAPVLFRIFASF